MKNKSATKKEIIRLFVWNVLSPILLGALLYFFFCPDVLFVMHLNKCGVVRNFNLSPQKASGFAVFIRNYFFDYIWAYALCCSVCIIYFEEAFAGFKGILVAGILGTVSEICQLIGFAKGTFDIYDILVEIIGAFSGAFIIKIFRRKQHEKN